MSLDIKFSDMLEDDDLADELFELGLIDKRDNNEDEEDEDYD